MTLFIYILICMFLYIIKYINEISVKQAAGLPDVKSTHPNNFFSLYVDTVFFLIWLFVALAAMWLH